MTSNKLKMNGDKTEIMICGSKPKLRNIQIESISIDSDPIDISDHVRNLGFFLDKHLNMNVHVSNLRKSCYFELRKILLMKNVPPNLLFHMYFQSLIIVIVFSIICQMKIFKNCNQCKTTQHEL